ncbi:MAG: hypothetical protein JO047_14805, partial [Alphaproteobacteria bacterium]|nr:hypothetical protein [Alphaproteobacteria bacterium]
MSAAGAAPPAARAPAATLAAGNRVLLLLAALGLIAVAWLDLLTRAPNRLVSGAPVPLGVIAGEWRWVALLP